MAGSPIPPILGAGSVVEATTSPSGIEPHWWRVAVESAGIGAFDWNLATHRLSWDDRLIDMFGYERATFDHSIEAFNARVHPDDLPRVTAALRSAIETCGHYAAEYRLVLPGETTRWLVARGRAVPGDDGRAARLVGAVYDTTSGQESEARFTRALESMSAAFYSLDREWRFTYVNAEAEMLLGRHRQELLGGVIWDLLPAAAGSDFETNFRHAWDTGQPVVFEAYYPAPLDRWYELRAWPGQDNELAVYFLEITARRSAEQQARRNARRGDLLASVTEDLTSPLDTEKALERLAQLVVPELGDWCIVTLVDDEHLSGLRGLREVGSWHVDPAARTTVEQYARARLQALSTSSFLHQALESRRPVRIPAGATAAVTERLSLGPAQELLRELGPESAVVLPLRGRSRTVGVLTLYNGPDRMPMTNDEFATAQDVAVRAGLAVDASRLYEQQRDLAQGLQRALLTDPPEPDHVQIVVRYEPAAEAAQVGGDWYDAFLQKSGTTVLVIGDVIGHDTDAAAAMGQVRTLLRGVAVTTGAGPAELLHSVDHAMKTLQVGTSATVVAARLEQTEDERDRGVTRLRWSNAGHPPPMVIGAAGTVRVLAGVEADLLLGIDADSERVESEITLDREATLFFYTDGLVERRGQSLDAGLAKLRRLLEELGTRDLDELCDEVLSRMLPDNPEDDVALLAVRLHRQDRPRPGAAGPNRVPPDVPVHR